jgi:hypothetical protein
MILLRLTCNALNFGIVIRWRLVFKKHFDQMHPIVCWFLFRLIYYHQILPDCFFARFCVLDQRFR